MSDYSIYSRAKRWPRRVLVVAGLLVLLFLTAIIVVHQVYSSNLAPVSSSTEQKVVIVQSGASVKEIGESLYKEGLIRQVWAFERYVQAKGIGSKLQAGTYKFTPSESVSDITAAMVNGKVAVDLITILPGQRIDQLKAAFIKAKFDEAAVDAAFDPAQYVNSPALADKPASASLEGFLYPDSYQKDATTDPKSIIQASLDEMAGHLTPDLRASFAERGLSVYQAVTMASILEREVSTPDDRSQVAQVFYKRIQTGMSLQSDVTAFYGAVIAGKTPSVDYASPYNTYKIKGLPAGPISNVTESSLQAVAHPASTDWLYFVAGDDGKTRFSKTLAEHEALVAQYCHKLCGE